MFRSGSSFLAARGGAVLGGLLSLVRVWGFALTQNSLMDEGEYLLKGYLFVTRQYWPFQEYGIWTNQMPFAFLIPGWVQMIFGVGIQTGRGYALVLNALILIALWFVARQVVFIFRQEKLVVGEWLAAGAVWVYALNTAALKMYSTTTSQVLITCMLVGILLLILGEKRPLWQLILAGMLSGAMLLTRLNLVPALPFIAGYIFWQHGKRAGMWATSAMILTIALGHAIFWPGILRAWAAWVPPPFSTFLAPWRPPEGIPFWNPIGDIDSRVLSFLFAIRYHFVAFLGLFGVIVWGWRWKQPVQQRAAVFLAALFFALLAAHAWASLGSHQQTDNALGNDYCVFCFPVYTSFFSILGILLVVMWLASWPWTANRIQDGLTAVGVLLLTSGVGYGAYKDIGGAITHWRIPRLKTLLSSGEPVPGIPLWDFLDSRFQIGFEVSKKVLPTLAGMLVGIAVGVFAFWLHKRLVGRGERVSVGAISLAVLLFTGAIASPGKALGGGYTNYDCSGNVIAAYESAGAHLAGIIPPHSTVYWQGSLSSAPLVYLDTPQILPGQINLDYTLRLSGSDDAHLRFGFWTETLAQDWLARADYAIVAERYYQGWLREALENPTLFIELPSTAPLAPCNDASYLRVFHSTK
jgi:hypothetical protein